MLRRLRFPPTVPHLTKVKHAVVQLLHMYYLSTDTAESQGRMTFPVSGRIVFDKVCFTYPSRPDAQVLNEVSFEIQPGECVAIVGWVVIFNAIHQYPPDLLVSIGPLVPGNQP